MPGPLRSGRPARAAAVAADRQIALHAHAWLAAGCAAGLALATLLLSPRLGDWTAPLSYGRWAALHLDLTLYGWLAVPLLGLLLRAYGLDERPRAVGLALALWSGALAAGAATWLAGRTSGKLFLDWSGGAARLFAVAQAAIVALLAAAAWLAYGDEAAARPLGAARRRFALRALGVAALAGVPAVLLFAERADVYPAIDPASGGPTAASLVGSTLALVALVLLAPRLAGLPRRDPRGGGVVAAAFVSHAVLFAVVDHGDRANDAPQLLLLATVALWAVLLPRDLRRFAWPRVTERWRAAATAWGALLVVTGVAQFAGEPLARLKFTHALVAHAHLAMAGFASAFAALLLRLGIGTPPAGERATFWLWQGGTAAHVAALAALGALEAADPALLLRGGATVTALFALRWLAGAAMLGAALRWLGAGGEARA